MGQAKKRGTFEERRQQSIDATKAARAERQRKKAEWWNSLTDEEKQKEIEDSERRAQNMRALGLWLGASYFY